MYAIGNRKVCSVLKSRFSSLRQSYASQKGDLSIDAEISPTELAAEAQAGRSTTHGVMAALRNMRIILPIRDNKYTIGFKEGDAVFVPFLEAYDQIVRLSPWIPTTREARAEEYLVEADIFAALLTQAPAEVATVELERYLQSIYSKLAQALERLADYSHCLGGSRKLDILKRLVAKLDESEPQRFAPAILQKRHVLPTTSILPPEKAGKNARKFRVKFLKGDDLAAKSTLPSGVGSEPDSSDDANLLKTKASAATSTPETDILSLETLEKRRLSSGLDTPQRPLRSRVHINTNTFSENSDPNGLPFGEGAGEYLVQKNFRRKSILPGPTEITSPPDGNLPLALQKIALAYQVVFGPYHQFKHSEWGTAPSDLREFVSWLMDLLAGIPWLDVYEVSRTFFSYYKQVHQRSPVHYQLGSQRSRDILASILQGRVELHQWNMDTTDAEKEDFAVFKKSARTVAYEERVGMDPETIGGSAMKEYNEWLLLKAWRWCYDTRDYCRENLNLDLEPREYLKANMQHVRAKNRRTFEDLYGPEAQKRAVHYMMDFEDHKYSDLSKLDRKEDEA